MANDVRFFEGEPVTRLHVFGQYVDAYVTPYIDEVNRRRRSGLAAITNANALRVLMELPDEIPLPRSHIHPLDQMVLESLGPAIVELTHTMAKRKAVQPLQINGLIKYAQVWSDVQAASLLRTHAPCLVVAAGRLARRAVRETHPNMGVALMSDGELFVKRLPGARWVRPSWQRWMVAEKAFEAKASEWVVASP